MALTVTGTTFGSISVNSRTLTVIDHSNTPAVIVDNDIEDIVIAGVGVQGPPGPPGTASSDNYTYVQSVADNIWTINHTIPFRPNVSVVNSAGQVIYANVDYASATQIIITHSVPLTGMVYLS
jgi:hypothetical protein